MKLKYHTSSVDRRFFSYVCVDTMLMNAQNVWLGGEETNQHSLPVCIYVVVGGRCVFSGLRFFVGIRRSVRWAQARGGQERGGGWIARSDRQKSKEGVCVCCAQECKLDYEAL